MERKSAMETGGIEKPTQTSTAGSAGSHQGLDQAYDFLQRHGEDEQPEDQQQLRRIRRKVDWYIIPIMFLCYTMQFIDKVSLNVSPMRSIIRTEIGA